MTSPARSPTRSASPATDGSNYSTASEDSGSISSSHSRSNAAESRQNVTTEFAVTENPPLTDDVRVAKCICTPAALCWEATIFFFVFLLAAAVVSTFIWASAPESPSRLVSILALRQDARGSEVSPPPTTTEATDTAIAWGPCVSAACLEQSRIVLHQLNSSVDPCDDFYEHVCRNWVKSHPLQLGRESVSTDDLMEEAYSNMLVTAIKDERTEYAELRYLFKECMAPKPRVYHDLMDLFRKSLGLSDLNATWEKHLSSTQLSVVLGMAQRYLGIDAVYRISRQDPAAQRRSMYYLDPLLSYFRRSFHTDIFAVEQRLVNYFRHHENQNFDECSSLMVSQLPVTFRIEWLPLLRAALGKPDLPPSTPVKLASPEYLFGLAVEDAVPPPTELIHYVLFRVAALLLPLNDDPKDLWDAMAVPLAFDAFLQYLRKTETLLRMGAGDGDLLDAPRLFFVYYAASLCEHATPQFLSWMAGWGVRSPAWFRVNGPLRNMPQFADAFRCRAKSFMNPTRKCPFTGLR
ncbi:unnamed protein product [Ixodes hexagonus]